MITAEKEFAKLCQLLQAPPIEEAPPAPILAPRSAVPGSERTTEQQATASSLFQQPGMQTPPYPSYGGTQSPFSGGLSSLRPPMNSGMMSSQRQLNTGMQPPMSLSQTSYLNGGNRPSPNGAMTSPPSLHGGMQPPADMRPPFHAGMPPSIDMRPPLQGGVEMPPWGRSVSEHAGSPHMQVGHGHGNFFPSGPGSMMPPIGSAAFR